MEAIIVIMECITNMHVGNGDVNFNIIDNEVERDVVTGYPTVNASGVKGALREYFARKGVDSAEINQFFGNTDAGKLRILSADMLAMPARASEGDEPYYLVSTDEAISRYEEKYHLFISPEIKFNKTTVNKCKKAEGYLLKEKVEICNKEIHILPNEEFRKISLPVIARNKLDNGKSVNLWYEEVVPHKSLFTFVVLAEEVDKALLEAFKKQINGNIVQFGGNASIGYGLCKISVIEKTEEK